MPPGGTRFTTRFVCESRIGEGFPPPLLLYTDSGNDDLARGEGILKPAMGEGEDAENKNSDRL